MKTWSVCALSNCGHRVDISGLRKQQHQDQLARIAVFLLVFTFCCPLHAQNDDYVSSNTNVITIDTKVVISAPLAVFTKSLDIFTTGIPIHPVYIQAPSGMSVWLSIRCKGGAARLSLPDYVANYSLTQTEPSGPWNPAVGTLNATDGTYLVTGLGIKFNQNISVSNDVLTTLAYGKGADNDIAGKATMTITVNWTITIPNRADTFQRLQSKRIVIWAPTSLTSISTFRATVAAICLLGIFIICCFCSLNTVAVSSLRRFSVTLARETRDQQECEQNRVFNPLWMPCAPTLADYNIESTPNPLMLMQRRKELKTKILRMRTPFSLMDRILRASHVKTSHYTCVRCRFPCAPASPPLRDSSSDDDKSDTLEAASKNRSGCCLRSPGSDDGTPSSEVDRDSTTPRDPQLLSAQPCDPPQVGSQPVAPSTAIPALTQANWRPSQQGATRDIEKYPAEPGVYLRDQYNRQDGGPQGNRGGSENITVGYAFVQHRLAPSQGVHVDPNLTCARNRFVFGAEDEILDPTLATKNLDSVSDSEVEAEVVAESDLEFESEMRFEAASNLCDDSSLSFSRGLRVSESPPAERGSDSGRTSECFRSPLSDLYEDVLESCSPISSRRSPWRSDASMYADPSALRMQQRS